MRWFVFLLVFSFACSSPAPTTTPAPNEGPPDDSLPDGGAAIDATPSFAPAAHPSAPQLIDSKGRKLATPRFVSVTFAGDAMASEIGPFVAWLLSWAF
jgi:hypothetical protein